MGWLCPICLHHQEDDAAITCESCDRTPDPSVYLIYGRKKITTESVKSNNNKDKFEEVHETKTKIDLIMDE